MPKHVTFEVAGKKVEKDSVFNFNFLTSLVNEEKNE